ncbi:hypothetical protein MINTM005_13710 [Mycobacterium intracellulare]|uniref:ribonuclease H-like domain-containing protein n=1 Tax=Mycobacterium intracellulare TaxID=1767 RepID=UPI0019264698|nr:ribonuclease H-like domain-containing protein [Mycobacterium intracellulare]BCO56127.1 hypothetical protein MINTM005_13710 [Mycobacterium intracellulare]
MSAAPKILTLDIETQPATAEVWSLWDQNIGIQQIVEPSSVLCFAAKWEHQKQVQFFAEWDGRGIMLDAAHELLDEADYVVTWNGRKFDIPHLMGEFLLTKRTPPSPHRDIDLFLVAKKNFNLMSNKLDFYSQQLGVGAKVKNGGFGLWQEIRRPKSEASLLRARKLMQKYNEADVVLTEKLFRQMRPWISGMNCPAYNEELGKPGCTRCGSTNLNARGWAYTTTLRYRRFRCMDCGGWMRSKKSEPTPNAELRNA